MRRAATAASRVQLLPRSSPSPSTFAHRSLLPTTRCAALRDTSLVERISVIRTARHHHSSRAAAMASSHDENAASAPAASSSSSKAADTTAETLPPLSPADFRIYNRLADKMDLFHNHFRSTWNLLFTACTNNKRPSNMSLRQFLAAGLHFADQLTAHHTIEERYVFPMLAARMPEFDPRRGDLIKQHAEIHKGLDEFEGYLRRCKGGEEDFEMAELRRRMEGWGDILWRHLDEEVASLGADKMRHVWSKEEMAALPM